MNTGKKDKNTPAAKRLLPFAEHEIGLAKKLAAHFRLGEVRAFDDEDGDTPFLEVGSALQITKKLVVREVRGFGGRRTLLTPVACYMTEEYVTQASANRMEPDSGDFRSMNRSDDDLDFSIGQCFKRALVAWYESMMDESINAMAEAYERESGLIEEV